MQHCLLSELADVSSEGYEMFSVVLVRMCVSSGLAYICILFFFFISILCRGQTKIQVSYNQMCTRVYCSTLHLWDPSMETASFTACFISCM